MRKQYLKFWKKNHAYSRIIFEWYGVVLEHISGSFHFQYDYNWRGILYFFSCQFWFFIFELVFESFFEPKFHFYSCQVFSSVWKLLLKTYSVKVYGIWEKLFTEIIQTTYIRNSGIFKNTHVYLKPLAQF